MRAKQLLSRWLAGLFVLALSVVPAAGQTGGASRQPVGVEVVGGMNLATLTVPAIPVELEDLGLDLSVKRRAGLAAGVLVGVRMRDGVSFETGALLSQKGASTKVTVAGFGTGTGSVHMTYLDVPALVRFRVVSPVSLLAGSTIGFRLHAKATSSFMGESVSETVTDEVAPVDVGLTFGGRIELGRALVDVRYTHGLVNTATEPGDSIKHRVLSFMAGWRF